MQPDPLVCAVEADDRTWHHLITLARVEADGPGPALVVAECAEHPSGPPLVTFADLPG